MTRRKTGVRGWMFFIVVALLALPGLYFGLREFLRINRIVDWGTGVGADVIFVSAMIGPFTSILALIPLLALLLTRRAHLLLKLTAVILVVGCILLLVHFKSGRLLG